MSKRVERAAGGIVVRGQGAHREVLLIDDAYGRVTFPKGHLEAGETWEDAAIREILEETGIETRILAPLGRVEYPITRDGAPVRKQVRFYLLEAIDSDVTPTHQAEEVRAAYFLPMAEAEAKHREQGYANWSFVFAKARALLAWRDGEFERRWRQLSNDTARAVVDEAWKAARPVVEQMVAACRDELTTVMPELTLPPVASETLPRGAAFDVDDIRFAVEHTLLKPEASVVDIENLCREAKEYRFPLVCVNPQHVSHAALHLAESETEVCTVVGFPLGATSPDALAAEVLELAAKGAREIDMVIPVGSLVEDDVWTVYHHVARVVRTAQNLHPRPAIKVILEASALTFDQVIKGAFLTVAAGADYIKTSTGFHKGGATLADVSAMAMVAGTVSKVKAAGGVRTPTAAYNLLAYGASRLGTSSGVQLVR
ncbi:deoxyribose-phosphate aldolase [Alicyclobacillus suci]|uniref:deoxyribose-phosphate aldolase n=1 Tax=Alicyclobacillus suci TaxID=2816080 RepID=UPI001A8EB8BC|nr:deoxyribose-phosphate aldolase [Alicyclobacillus suci]